MFIAQLHEVVITLPIFAPSLDTRSVLAELKATSKTALIHGQGENPIAGSEVKLSDEVVTGLLIQMGSPIDDEFVVTGLDSLNPDGDNPAFVVKQDLEHSPQRTL